MFFIDVSIAHRKTNSLVPGKLLAKISEQQLLGTTATTEGLEDPVLSSDCKEEDNCQEDNSCEEDHCRKENDGN